MVTSTVAVAVSLPVVITTPASSPKPSTTGELPSHHEKGFFKTTYRNPWDSYVQVNPILPSTLYQMWKEWRSPPIPPPELLPQVMIPTWGIEESFTEDDTDAWRKDIKATWLGHACFLVEFPSPSGSTVRGPRVLFDPCFDDRCSPSQIIGPKRVTQPPFPIQDMPEVDMVVISHNHYDHLSVDSIRQLYAKQEKGTIHFFAPLGNKAWFENEGIAKAHCTEMDWWDERDVKTSQASTVTTGGDTCCSHLRLTCTPAQHFTGRSVHDRFHTLWSSWSVSQLPTIDATTSTSRIWFGGDTGYKSVPENAKTEEGLPTCPAYKEIGEKLGPFDFSMIPIGAYDPRFFMSSIHLSPEDAVEVHKEVKSLKSMGMHFATWVLTCEEMTEPPKRLRIACEKNGISEAEFGVSGIGETTRITPSGNGTKL